MGLVLILVVGEVFSLVKARKFSFGPGDFEEHLLGRVLFAGDVFFQDEMVVVDVAFEEAVAVLEHGPDAEYNAHQAELFWG